MDTSKEILNSEFLILNCCHFREAEIPSLKIQHSKFIIAVISRGSPGGVRPPGGSFSGRWPV
jgi:hypothetical protein